MMNFFGGCFDRKKIEITTDNGVVIDGVFFFPMTVKNLNKLLQFWQQET